MTGTRPHHADGRGAVTDTATLGAAWAELAGDAAKADCRRCGNRRVLAPLHLELGGPELCMPCGMDVRADAKREGKMWRKAIAAIGGGTSSADPDELSRELLDDAVKLTHPDRHPPERRDLADRVTAELLALRPHTKPRPKPNPERDRSASVLVFDDDDPSRYPCAACAHLAPLYYCDPCRERWDQERREERERENARRRELRAQRRASRRRYCAECYAVFKPARADARYCSPACRQAAYRRRKSAS